jgi:hypothetical protein
VKVGFIGLNPAIAQNLVETFGVENVKITDLNKQNVNSSKYGVKVWDGNKRTEELIKECEFILITGTTLVNGTFDHIVHSIRSYKKDYLVYGVTGAGICKLMGFNRICPYRKGTKEQGQSMRWQGFSSKEADSVSWNMQGPKGYFQDFSSMFGFSFLVQRMRGSF